MQMTKAQAVAELERIQELLPLIAEAVKEERKPVNRYAKTSYFKEAYGQSMGTVKNSVAVRLWKDSPHKRRKSSWNCRSALLA